jgi:phage protein D
MTPIYKVVVNGTNITELVKTRLLSLSVSDSAGTDSDTVEMSLDDRDARLEIPKIGVEMTVWLGYKETGLVKMGSYIIDEVTLSGMPEEMSLRGKAASMTGDNSVKDQKTRQWNDISIADLVSKIAKEHGLTPKVDSEMSGYFLKDLSQTEESNIHLLTRVGEDYDAVVKVTDGNLIFAKKGTSRTVSGEPVPPVTIHKSQCKSGYNVTYAERDSFKSVKAKWHNKATAKVEYVDSKGRNRKKNPKENMDVETSNKEPQKTLKHTFDTKEQAEAACRAEMEKLNRGGAKLSLQLSIGSPTIAAEGCITLTGFRSGINGDWNVTSVTHNWSNSGAATSLNAESI